MWIDCWIDGITLSYLKGWEPEWSIQQNIVFEIIDIEVFLVDQKQWSVRIVHGWYAV